MFIRPTEPIEPVTLPESTVTVLPRKNPKKASSPGISQNMAAKLREMLSSRPYAISLEQRLLEGKLGAGMEALMFYYAFGKPTETMNINAKLSALSDKDLAQLESLAERIER